MVATLPNLKFISLLIITSQFISRYFFQSAVISCTLNIASKRYSYEFPDEYHNFRLKLMLHHYLNNFIYSFFKMRIWILTQTPTHLIHILLILKIGQFVFLYSGKMRHGKPNKIHEYRALYSDFQSSYWNKNIYRHKKIQSKMIAKNLRQETLV